MAGREEGRRDRAVRARSSTWRWRARTRPDSSLPIALEELCWGCAGIGLAIFGTGLPLSALAYSGTPMQFAEWAPQMFGTPEEPAVASFCVTEPNAGSDVSALRTTAKRDGDEWVLNGQKVFATNGGIAAVHIVVATVDPSLGHRGQAAFIVGPDTPGHPAGQEGAQARHPRLRHRRGAAGRTAGSRSENVLGGAEKLEAKLEKARAEQRVVGGAQDVRDDAAVGGGAGPRDRAGRVRVLA